MNGYVIQTGNGRVYGPFNSVGDAARWVQQSHDCQGILVTATNNAPCACILLVLNKPEEEEDISSMVEEVEREAYTACLPAAGLLVPRPGEGYGDALQRYMFGD